MDLQTFETSKDENYSYNIAILKSDMVLYLRINSRWVQCFCEMFEIVCRSLTGNKSMSSKVRGYIERDILIRVGPMCKIVEYGVW